MKKSKALIVALIGILALSSCASGIQVSVSSNAGGFTETIDAGLDDRISGSTTIGRDRLSNSITGNADFKESHSVSNTAGATAEVGVDIRDAEWYSYSYDLWPGQGSNWKAAKYPQVAASEDLDVLNASYIQAYADAFNSKGYRAGVNTVISDPENEASIMGYSNLAMASKNEASASQTYDWASSPNGYIQAETSAEFTQMKSRPLRFVEDKAESKITVDSGFVEGYSDLASASALGVTASQQIDAATGEQIQTGTLASARTASFFQGLKAERAKVNTEVEGRLTGYNASAESRDGSVHADQTGQIIGSFTSSALAGSASKTRSSNYGDIYDFSMQAKKDSSGSYASGTLGYYVNNVSPTANRIQGAVDAAESGDNINVAPGMYFENVRIDKSLDIKGAGAGETVVDGQQSGSVIVIGKDNPNVDVAISDMTIQGGSGSLVEVYPGYTSNYGGGILNYGTLMLKDTIISGNNADCGGGIYSSGKTTIIGSNISKNAVNASGGGIFNSQDGVMNIVDGSIFMNTAIGQNYSIIYYAEAFGCGGGIYNEGALNLNGSFISYNNATGYGYGYNSGYGYGYGGGIYSNGTLNLEDSTISYNTAMGYGSEYGSGSEAYGYGYGGGIYSNGTLNLNRINIFNNSAKGYSTGSYDVRGNGYGGGIYSDGRMNLNSSLISNNIAAGYSSGVLWAYGYGYGGGIYTDGISNLGDNSFSNNNATGYGYVSGYGYSQGLGFGYGGAIYNNGDINLESSSILNNNVLGSGSAFGAGYGGGVWNSGLLNLSESNVSGNNAKGLGSGSNYGVYYGNGFGLGGGIYSSGDFNLIRSSISDNNATGLGSGACSGYGGGIYSEGIVGTEDSFISNNKAIGYGYESKDAYNYGYGGGIYSTGSVYLNSSAISGNVATGDGVGSGFGYGGGVYSGERTILSLKNSSVSGNNATGLAHGSYYVLGNGYGGGIYGSYYSTMDLKYSSVLGNTAFGSTYSYGGGICSELYSTTNLMNSSVFGNTVDGLKSAEGGGIYNTGTLTLETSDIISNTAKVSSNEPFGLIDPSSGGGIHNQGTMSLNMCSISSNSASIGGGIRNSGVVYLYGGSIDHNTATSPAPSGGGIYNWGWIYGDTGIVHDNTPDQIVNS